MKKYTTKIIPLVVMIVLIMSVGMSVSAQDGITFPTENTGSGFTGQTSKDSTSIFTLQNPLRVNSVGDAVQAFIEIFSYIVILFAVLMFIYVGFQYILNAAQGNAAKIKDLHKQLMWLVIGVAVVIAARVIVQIVISTLEAANVASPEVIRGAKDAIKSN